MAEFKLKKARIDHICSKCKKNIEGGEEYYCEEKFLKGLHASLEKYCKKCYKK